MHSAEWCVCSTGAACAGEAFGGGGVLARPPPPGGPLPPPPPGWPWWRGRSSQPSSIGRSQVRVGIGYCRYWEGIMKHAWASDRERGVLARPPRAVEGCGGVWRGVEGCGGVWRGVEGCGGVWRGVPP